MGINLRGSLVDLTVYGVKNLGVVLTQGLFRNFFQIMTIGKRLLPTITSLPVGTTHRLTLPTN